MQKIMFVENHFLYANIIWKHSFKKGMSIRLILSLRKLSNQSYTFKRKKEKLNNLKL